MHLPVIRSVAPLLILIACLGCSSSDGPAGETPAPGSDAAADSPPDSAAEAAVDAPAPTLSVAIFDARRAASAAVTGAIVTLEQAGVSLGEATSDASGAVVLPRPDWSKGPAALFVRAEGYAYRSVVGMTTQTLSAFKNSLSKSLQSEPHDVIVLLSPLSNGPGFVTVSGKLPTVASGHFSVVTPSVSGSFFQNFATQYTLRVSKGVPFSLMALEVLPLAAQPREIAQEFLRLSQAQHAAADTDVQFDLDTGMTDDPLVDISVKLEIPGGDQGPLGGTSQGYFWITSQESAAAAFFGAATHCAPSPDLGSFVCEGKYGEPSGLNPSYLTVGSIALSDGSESQVITTGIPQSGGVLSGFQAPIPVTLTTLALQDDVPTPAVPAGTAAIGITLQAASAVWQIHSLDVTAASFKLPSPPADVLAALGDTVTARLQCMGPSDPTLGFRLWGTVSRTFTVTVSP